MELRQLVKILLRRWWVIAVPAVVALAYAGYGYVTAPPSGGFSTSLRYTASVSTSAVEPENYEDAALAPWTSSEYVTNALADWVRTGSFAEEVSAELADSYEFEVPPGAIQSSIAADNERSVMVLFLSWGDPAQLEIIAEAATTVLQEKSGEYFPQIGEVGVEVIALDDPVVGAVPPPLTARVEPLIRFGLGLVAGVALAFLVEYLDPTVRERGDIEAMGLAVLAEVPFVRGE